MVHLLHRLYGVDAPGQWQWQRGLFHTCDQQQLNR